MRLLGLGFMGGSEEELTTDLLIFRKIDRTVSLFLKSVPSVKSVVKI